MAAATALRSPAAPARARLRSWATTAVGCALVGFMLFPVYWMVNASLQPSGNLLDAPWFPLDPDLGGYARAIADQGGHLVTSLVVSLGAVVVCLLVATPAAYGLAQLRLPGGGLLLFAVLVTQMVPGIVVANALYSAYNDLRLLDTTVGLVLADAAHGIPFSILVMRAFMQAIPVEITEAARIDGASRWRAFRSVVVPVSANALITAGLFTFLFAWSDFLFAVTLTTSDDVKPITLGIYQYLGTNTSEWGATMATAVLASLPAAVLLVAAQKYVAAGATGGALK